jgi:hypothetical protein
MAKIEAVSTLEAAPEQAAAPRGGRLAQPWKPGQSGNPGGIGGPVREAQRIAREATPKAMRKLVELLDSKDDRVVAVAIQALLDRSMGKPKEAPPDREGNTRLDMSRLSNADMADFKRMLSKIADVPEPSTDAPMIEGMAGDEDTTE